jgi:thiamine biosynthesis lipoprotein ApbE
MGTEIELFVDTQAPDGPMDEAEREFRRLELILSRFLPDSELSRLNRARVMRVGPELAELVPLAIAARTAAEAEVLATALFLSGEAERAAREADAQAVPAVIVARDGRALLAGGLA